MTKTKQTYKLGKIKQLVDLNRDITNFDLNFAVSSKDGSEFYSVVVDQTMLDNEPNPEYKKVKGSISGNIVADKGVYQNYFLILKADNPCECDVTIDIKEIPKNQEWEKQLINAEHEKRQEQHDAQVVLMQNNETRGMKTSVIIGIALVALFGVVFYFQFCNKSSGSSSEVKSSDNISVKSEKSSAHPSPSPSPDYNSHRYGYGREPLFSKFR